MIPLPALLLAVPAFAGWNVIDFVPGYDLSGIERNDVELTLTANGVLEIRSGHAIDWPGITIKAPAAHWSFTGTGALAMDVHNSGTIPVELGLRIDNPGGFPGRGAVQETFTIGPGERRTVATEFKFKLPDEWGLFGMNGYPGAFRFHAAGEQAFDPADVSQLIVFVPKPKQDHVFEIARIRTTGEVPPLPDPKTFFPFIDEFGQYIHRDWPGKLHSAAEWTERIIEEGRDLAAHPGPADRDKWGGWTAGPRLKPEGFFRVAKVRGKWWFVDPDGALFWSHGVDCVCHWGATIVQDREKYFRGLPAGDPAFKDLFQEGGTKPSSHWRGAKVRQFDFCAANIRRKYGPASAAFVAEHDQQRLRSWGLNTIGMWSDSRVMDLRRTPYVGTIHWWAPQLEGSEGHRASFYDVYHPDFRKNIGERMASEKGKTAGDPWCLGYFIDNELSWPDATGFAEAALASPPDQPAKGALLYDLKARYGTIERLNRAWGTSHASWEDLKLSRTPPGDPAKADLTAFSLDFAKRYFRECRKALKEVAPDQLYLGCRFAGRPPDYAAKAAAEFCDVVSFNMYTRGVGDLALPAGCKDRPVIIGEFHCGALDRGLFHTGLQSADNQAQRARFYVDYVTSALRNPSVVGCAWFQYMDQPATGRPDGENYQIGFVDICDEPYPETIAAVRDIGYRLYELRR